MSGSRSASSIARSLLSHVDQVVAAHELSEARNGPFDTAGTPSRLRSTGARRRIGERLRTDQLPRLRCDPVELLMPGMHGLALPLREAFQHGCLDLQDQQVPHRPPPLRPLTATPYERYGADLVFLTSAVARQPIPGFRQEGLRPDNTWFKGEWSDELLFGLLRSDWLS